MCIAATERGTLSPVAPIFGRSSYFTFWEEGSTIVTVENPYRDVPSGSGIQAAQFIVGQGAAIVVSGNYGPYAAEALSMAGVRILSGVGGTVAEIINRFTMGEMPHSRAAAWPPAALHRFPRRGRCRGGGGLSGVGRGRRGGFSPPPLPPERERLVQNLEKRALDLRSEVDRLRRRIEEIEGGEEA